MQGLCMSDSSAEVFPKSFLTGLLPFAGPSSRDAYFRLLGFAGFQPACNIGACWTAQLINPAVLGLVELPECGSALFMLCQ